MGNAGPRRILGIDPGSRRTGFGVLELHGGQSRYVASGVIQAGDGAFPGRLRTIFEGLGALIAEHGTGEAAIEQVFVNRNADSALKLGQARGAAICACASHGLPVSEYGPRAVKQALVGGGAADKRQVAYMVRMILGLEGRLQEDAADALAIALCHAQHDRMAARLAAR
ncbi:crossover junction endodeoxyribonuclease RuvC [Sediminicurvatus halobius]|uniref:crossover junction endodeoxyribonuclease RuvC n=1 Tax=Sediminicurvatus halobius TaxID=2182432 RepID=UPI001E431E66|nr:crossover junction endodeoxyribonuclease RuvC [Spiribacter halobius]UEX78645.1 crossover junction endodeoxyribonuclease RuvC [Spiribacter halobius]